jgi:hypothetical protein
VAWGVRGVKIMDVIGLLPEWLKYLSTFIAGVTATVGVLRLYLERRDKQPKLVVDGSVGFLPGWGPEPDTPYYILNASNPGDRTVVLNTFEIGLPDGQKMVYPHMDCEKPLPAKLPHGESQTCWVEFEPLQEHLELAGYIGEVQATVRAKDAFGQLLRAIDDDRHAPGERGAIMSREGNLLLCCNTA